MEGWRRQDASLGSCHEPHSFPTPYIGGTVFAPGAQGARVLLPGLAGRTCWPARQPRRQWAGRPGSPPHTRSSATHRDAFRGRWWTEDPDAESDAIGHWRVAVLDTNAWACRLDDGHSDL